MIIIVTYILTFIGILAVLSIGAAALGKAAAAKANIKNRQKSQIPSAKLSPSRNLEIVNDLLTRFKRAELTKKERVYMFGELNVLLNKDFQSYEAFREWYRMAPGETQKLVIRAMNKWASELAKEYRAASEVEYTTQRLKVYLEEDNVAQQT